MKRIMFVCTGNICRSPMAHYYMQKKLYDFKKENDYMVSSCGTHAITGENATDNAIRAMTKYNVDLTKHKATNIHDTDIENYDYIFTLTSHHKDIILQFYPALNYKVHTIKEFVYHDVKYKDIDDPWGLDLNVYIATAEDIVNSIDKMMDMI